MKKLLILIITAALVIGMLACGNKGSENAKAIETLEDYVTLCEAFIVDIEKAGDAEDVASALDSFSNKMADLNPDFKKYSKIEGMTGTKDYEKVSAIMNDYYNEIIPKFNIALQKVAGFMDDPAVKKAKEKFQKIMNQ